MRKTLRRILAPLFLGTLVASVVSLNACQKIDSELEQPDTRAIAGHLNVGSIAENLTISTTSTGYLLTIPSVQPASCPTGPIIYLWEVMEQDSSWREFPFANNASLTTNPPMQEKVYYRRKAVCGHLMDYSNICTVTNIGIPSAGEIAAVVELNKGGFTIEWHIPSLREPSAGAQIGWEAYIDGVWTTKYDLNGRHLTKVRRTATKDSVTAYSNECTVIDYACYDNPRMGSSTTTDLIDLGTYGDNFIVNRAVNTTGEYFWDQDRITFCGNDAFMKLALTKPMVVDFRTGSLPIGVRLTVWQGVEYWEDCLFDGGTSVPYALRPIVNGLIPYTDFDKEDEFARKVTLELPVGEYTVHIQGMKATNGGVVNELIGVIVRGTVK